MEPVGLAAFEAFAFDFTFRGRGATDHLSEGGVLLNSPHFAVFRVTVRRLTGAAVWDGG